MDDTEEVHHPLPTEEELEQADEELHHAERYFGHVSLPRGIVRKLIAAARELMVLKQKGGGPR